MLADLNQIRVAPTLHWNEEWGAWMKFDAIKKGGGMLAEKSLAAYLQSAKHFVHWFEQVRPAGAVLGMRFGLEHFTMQVVREYFAWQKAQRVPAKSFNHRYTTLKKIARWALLMSYIEDDPTRVVERIHRIESAPRRLGTEKVKAIDAVASTGSHLKRATEKQGLLGLRDQVIWGLFNCGLRVSEVSAADLRDLDLELGELRVIGKGGTEGNVQLTGTVMEAIKTWLTVRSGLRFASASTALITNWNGLPITPCQVRRRLQAMGSTAGVKVRPHDMRHETIHQIIEKLLVQGWALHEAVKAAQTQARHGDARTTWSYLQVPAEQVRAAMEVM